MLHNLFCIPQNVISFIILSFFVPIIHFLINRELKFKYPLQPAKGYRGNIAMLNLTTDSYQVLTISLPFNEVGIF